MTVDEQASAARALRAQITVMERMLGEMKANLAILTPASVKATPAARPALDANGEPTWDSAVKRKLPADFHLTKALIAYAGEHQFSPEQALVLLEGTDRYEGFRRYYTRAGTKWAAWTMVWQQWVRKARDDSDTKKARESGSGNRPANPASRYR